MKRLINVFGTSILLFVLICFQSFAADDAWRSAPSITSVYECSKEDFAIQWDGKADLYLVVVDGKGVETTKFKNAKIKLKSGQHTITILPMKKESRNIDPKFAIDISKIGGASIDLSALGIDPKNTLQGTESKPVKLNYTINPILNATPEITGAYTDFNDNVNLTFTDKYDSDVYTIYIKSGKDVIPTEFDRSSKDAAKLISTNNSTVTVTLDRDYLKEHEWMRPDLDRKYSFSVKLGKHPKNYVNDSDEPDSILNSKDSKFYDYTPYAAWKNAPEITYASQTADGEITIKWDHDDNGLGCEYKIVSPEKLLVVKKGNKEIGKTTKKEFIVKDVMNGKHTFSVIPVLGKEDGISSEDQTVEVVNNWVVAPSLECSLNGSKKVLLKWDAPAEVNSYHVTVYAGSGSLLRFVNLDYKKYKEFDVACKPGKMEYTFTYDENIDSKDGVKLKFEIYATRKTEKGAEQKSTTSKQTITVK